MRRLLTVTAVRLEVEQNQLVSIHEQLALGVYILEGLQNGRFLEECDAENL